MKKLLCIIGIFLLAGCVTVKIPKYLQPQFPYKQKFYSDFDSTLSAARQALTDNGWRISEMTSPTIFESDQAQNENSKQILIFTESRQTPLIFSSRHMSLNVYIRQSGNEADVEIRYLAVTPMFFKNANNYKNDAVVSKIFDRIAELLKK